MKIVYIEDDKHVNWLTTLVLEKAGHSINSFEEPLKFLEALNNGDLEPGPIDCFLIDRELPGIKGLELMRQLAERPEFAKVPFIMLTGKSSPEDIASGLQAGIYAYLTKPCPKKILLAALSQAENQVKQRRDLEDMLSKTRAGLDSMDSIELSLRTPEQASAVAALLANLTNDAEKTSIGFFELLINAIEHGNLAIDYATKSALLESGDYDSEVFHRLAAPQYRDKIVRVSAKRQVAGLMVRIEDEGDGFDWKNYLDFDPDRAFDLHGRGIAMANKGSLDRLSYLGKGNIVEIFCISEHLNQPAVRREPEAMSHV